MSKERRLGRGLEALLGRPLENETDSPAPGMPVAAPAGPPQQAALSLIDRNPFQPRKDFDEADLAEMAGSLKTHGLLQPLLVRRSGDRFQLIAGERRLRAAQKLGWQDIAIRLIEADDRLLAEAAIVENLQRKDLNAIEKATAFSDYLKRYGGTHDELATRLGIDRSTVANLIRLLELPPAVQDMVRSSTLSAGHARALLPLGDDSDQITFAEKIAAESLSVRQTEQLIREAINTADREPLSIAAGTSPKSPRTSSPQIASLEQQFRSALGAKVDIKQGSKDRGKVVIHFKNQAEFERLRDLLCSPVASSEAG